ncbi:uncharacterized protein LODBEIA_P14120 [Lodderomyces beijingensis]|uniref:Zinc finger Mcm10/DnaG-type domain-containing protein n=1 Tax=Lodderomyces beijingensis TaxID=1775926 RepID=A0ABP0ZHT2_9ASCO
MDPRYEQVDDEDLLSEDSSEEYKNLVKEFELKVEALKKKKKKEESLKQRSKRQLKEYTTPEVPASPEKKNRRKEDERKLEQEDEVLLSLAAVKQSKPSQFLSKLYDANLNKQAERAQSIDYSRRRFVFDFAKIKYEPRDVTNDACPISGHYLRKRYLSNQEVTEIINDTDPEMKFLKVDKLLAKTHKENNYAEPLYTNWCLAAFVIQKSDVLYTKADKKYMKLKIGNFDHSVDLVLFDDAFNKNWKLQQGDLILVLNPYINKYEIKIGEGKFKTGFNLKLDNSNIESILEIGSVRDFGICSFQRRSDNQRCLNVVNITKQKLCDIHIDMKFKQSTRMELNGTVSMRSPSKNKTKIYMSYNNKALSSSSTLSASAWMTPGFIKEFNEDSSFTSSGGMSKIDSDKFHDPKILQTQLKKRKLMNERANAALEQKLSKLSKHNSIVESLNLKPSNSMSNRASPTTSESHFPHSMISKIGFDPTLSEAKNPIKKTTPSSAQIEELYQLSQRNSTKKSLGVSAEDKQAKLKLWRSNIANLKNYDSKVQSSSLNASTVSVANLLPHAKSKSTVVSPQRKRKARVVDDGDSEDDDDGELDIEFGDDALRAKYAKMVGK